MSKTNDYDEWNSLQNVYNLTVDPQQQAYILNALAYNRVSWILNLYLDEILQQNSPIRRQDFFTVLNAVSRNPAGSLIAWYFARKNWQAIVKMYVILIFA